MRRESKVRAVVVAGVPAVVAVVLAASGCADRRDLPGKVVPPERVTYEGTIKAIFDRQCTSCHSGASPAARYDLTSYAGAKGSGLDGIPDAIAGDRASLLVVKSQAGGSMNAYYSGPEEVALVERWVVADSLAER